MATEQEDAFEQWWQSWVESDFESAWKYPKPSAKAAFAEGWAQGFDEANGKQNDDE